MGGDYVQRQNPSSTAIATSRGAEACLSTSLARLGAQIHVPGRLRKSAPRGGAILCLSTVALGNAAPRRDQHMSVRVEAVRSLSARPAKGVAHGVNRRRQVCHPLKKSTNEDPLQSRNPGRTSLSGARGALLSQLRWIGYEILLLETKVPFNNWTRRRQQDHRGMRQWVN